MRRLVVCCDGTWNSPENSDNGRPAPTNVRKFWASVADQDAEGIEQIRFYRTGVGTLGGAITRLLGGAIGFKLEDDIKSAYKFLAETYQPGDEIYLLGFSRGAYTARSLAGMIASVGLADLRAGYHSEDDKWHIVQARLLAYQNRKASGKKWLLRRAYRRCGHCPPYTLHGEADVAIRFLGAWDTVGAMGIPNDVALIKRLVGDSRHHKFHDTHLGEIVQTARHALALDEARIDFTPTLWTEVAEDRDVEQVWFSGVHGDVGGSYADHGLGDITLSWMMKAAMGCGLAFRDGALSQLAPSAQAVRHESHKGLFKPRRTRPRAVPSFEIGRDRLTHISNAALKRHRVPALAEPHYWPTRSLDVTEKALVPVHARDRWGETGIFVKAGETYHFRARGNWRDASIRADADGVYNSLRLGFGMALVPEGFRALLRLFPRTRLSDNSLSRRAKGRWFELIGVIANGRGVHPVTKILQDHQVERLGSWATVEIKADGYLYFFPNDAWWFYRNNSGSLTVEITRDA